MFRQHLSAVTGKRQSSHLLLACRHQAYNPSAWSACTSASLTRYFHCTLKESLQRAKDGDISTPSSFSEKSEVQQVKLSTPAAGHAYSGTVASHAPSKAPVPPRSSAREPASSSSRLRYSLELSLPHLSHRTPFADLRAAPSSSWLSDSAHKEDLLSSLRGDANSATRAASQQPAEALQPRWSTFVQLCEAIVTAAASRSPAPHSSAAAAESSHAGLCGITIPCKEPYFCAVDPIAEEANLAAADVDVTIPPSTIQAAIFLFHQHWHVPVTLALNTTVANRINARGQELRGNDALENGPTGASTEGIAAVVEDFAHTLGGRQVLLVRGDSRSTQHGTSPDANSLAPSPLRTSSDLVRCVRDCAVRATSPVSVQIVVAGYPQGHPLDRKWGVSPVAATTATDATTPPGSEGNDFFASFERDFNNADWLFAKVVEAPSSSTGQLPALRHLFHTLGRLHAVRHLWLTPSCYSADARADCMRQLMTEKVLLRGAEGQRVDQPSGEGARVIVTQMLTSAQEFTQFTEDVQRGLRTAAASSSSSSSSSLPAAVTVIPGVLLPHPTDANVLLRALYYSKVIPSARMQRALEMYRTDLKSVWRSIVTHNNTTPDSDTASRGSQAISHLQDVADGYMSTWPGLVRLHSETEEAAVEAFVKDAHRRASARFTAAWMAETVDLLCELQQQQQRGGRDPTPVHFFTMFNDQIDVRLAQLLDAHAARQPKQPQHYRTSP